MTKKVRSLGDSIHETFETSLPSSTIIRANQALLVVSFKITIVSEFSRAKGRRFRNDKHSLITAETALFLHRFMETVYSFILRRRKRRIPMKTTISHQINGDTATKLEMSSFLPFLLNDNFQTFSQTHRQCHFCKEYWFTGQPSFFFVSDIRISVRAYKNGYPW